MKKHTLLIVLFLIGTVPTVVAQIVNIPDATFKNILLNYSPVIDTNNDNEIQESEAAAVFTLDISGPDYVTSGGIANIIGIESFINLSSLNCSHNDIQDIDISALTALELLYCFDNNLTSLDLNTNVNLNDLSCGTNQISSLNLEFNTQLEHFKCFSSTLSSMDFSTNVLLKTLILVSDITALDVSANTALETLLLSFNQPFNQIDLSNNQQLTWVRLVQSEITSANFLSDLPNLRTIQFYNNDQLTQIDLSDNPDLEGFEIFDLPNLITINLKSGNNMNLNTDGTSALEDLASLESICVDDINTPPDFVEFGDMGAYVFTENCQVLAIDTATVNHSITMSPNPVVAILSINNSSKKVKEFMVYNMQGAIALKGNVNNTVDVSALSQGVYLIDVVFMDGTRHTDKIIKQ